MNSPQLAFVAKQPQSSFTRAQEGESLRDVALRVYGSSAFASTLWLANRDQLSEPDSTLPPRQLLRTPALQAGKERTSNQP
jgi:nucleoid-associated protein YgaU